MDDKVIESNEGHQKKGWAQEARETSTKEKNS